MLSIQDLEKFCSKNDQESRFGINKPRPRVGINKPWSRDRFTYATNGHIIVRVTHVAEILDNPRAPNAKELFDNALKGSITPSGIPDIPEPEYEDCRVCKGKGKFIVGEKEVVCNKCNGEGKFEVLEKTAINGLLFQNRYLRLIKSLSGYRFFPTKTDYPAWFTFDHGDGLLMPCKE